MKFTTTSVLAFLASAACGFVNELLPHFDLSSFSFDSVGLVRREDVPPASDAVWNFAKCKGEQFVKVFPMTDADAGKEYVPPRGTAQSPWAGDLKVDLAKWGWKEERLAKSVCELDALAYGAGWVNAMQQLGIRMEPWKDTWCYRVSHGSGFQLLGRATYNIDGTQYPYTGAYSQFGINAADGAIFAMDNLMPSSGIRKAFQRDPLPGELPALQSLSDILWSGWYRGSQPEDPKTPKNPNPANVRYLISMTIVNQESLSIIQRALKTKEKTKVSDWPGDTFDMSADEGKALLGSPNGKRWGYFVIQRKNDIGIRKIDRVTVFQGREFNIHMIFYVS